VSPAPPRRAALAFVFATLLVDSIALGIVIPVAPRLVAELGGGGDAAGARTYGLFVTVGALVQFFAAPILGVLSDRVGRRPVLLVSLVGLAADYVALALAPTLGWLFTGRVVSAITSATWATAFAYIADVAAPEERAKAFGRAASGFGLGFVLGPALGGWLGEVSPRLPFWVAAGLTLANAGFGWLALPESLARERRAPFSLARANPLGALALVRRQRSLLGLVGSRFLRGIAHDVQPVVFVLYAVHRYGWTGREVGSLLFAIGLAGTAVSAGLVEPLVRRLGERGTLLLGLASGAIAFAGFGFAPTPFWLYAFIPFEALWWVDGAAMQALLTRRVDASAQGELQGALAGVQSIASLCAPPLFALTYAYWIEPARAVQIPGAAFYLAAALMLASLCVAWRATARGAAVARPGSIGLIGGRESGSSPAGS
jgi:DHA1 family tetracycline resistance protein-like MFS transporter